MGGGGSGGGDLNNNKKSTTHLIEDFYLEDFSTSSIRFLKISKQAQEHPYMDF